MDSANQGLCPHHLRGEGITRCLAIWGTILLAGVVAIAGCAPHPRVAPLTSEQSQLNVESFEQVWDTIRDKHWDPDLGGLDWQAVHDSLLPKVAAAETMPAARGVMKQMIAELDQSHFGIIPASLYEDVDQAIEGGPRDGTAGIGVRVVGGQALVTSVEPGSPAEERGVRPGWEVLEVGDFEMRARLAALGEEFAGKTTRDLIMARAVLSRLAGDAGDSLGVLFRDGEDRSVERRVPLVVPKGNRIGLGNLPKQYVWIETERLAEGVGYIAFNFFLDPGRVMSAFNEAMTAFMDAPGVIIDLRGNIGGIGVMAMGMAGWLIEEQGLRLGTMYTRGGEIKFTVTPRPQTYAGPVAVLIDGLSASTSEILAGGLKDLGRVRTFGTPTAGAALPSLIEKLPNGDGFQYAIANYISEGGEALEGAGMIPDEMCPPEREALLGGSDPALDAALAWIREGGVLGAGME
ncbi:MAG: hypothetical protein KAY32_14300 [Candidatus Eisenbacteria sp.]|nr:hypothetical protein [Candidatus Eisenbacteria bacterium]